MTGPRWNAVLRPAVGWVSLAVAVLMVADLYGWLQVGAHGYYLFSPGTAPVITSSNQCRAVQQGDLVLPDGTPCARLDVPADRAHPISGSLYMVDVLVGPATPLDYLEGKIPGFLSAVDEGAQLIPRSEVLGSTPSSQLGCQDTQQMQGSTSTAAVVAVRRLGYTVTENDLGAQLYQVQPGTPAASAGLECNDVIVGVDGSHVGTAAQLVSVLHARKPGDTVSLTVRRQQPSGTTRTLTLTARLEGTPALPGLKADPSKPFLGIVAQTDVTFTFPFNVNVEVGDIGGPSAGLALTLGLLDVLSGGQLTGGHRVAATGTISLNGAVGDVGGVAQKAVAVRKTGAQIFFVPKDELAAARSHAGSMKVYAVTSLEQALQILKSLGGHIPPPSSGQNGSG
jgi:PDZ domain-containing protein